MPLLWPRRILPFALLLACGRGEDVAVCGNGIIEEGEACDDMVNNGEYGHCGVDCQEIGPYCGDGIIDTGEFCDDGEDNGLPGACCADCDSLRITPWVPPASGCEEARPQATEVTLTSPIGTTTATRALFGVEGGLIAEPICGEDYSCDYFSTTMTFAAEGDGGTFRLYYAEGANPPQSGPVLLEHHIDTEWAEVEAMMFIDGVAGSWDTDDPNNPPRLLGRLEGGATGSFEAVYCASLTHCQWPD